MSGHATGWVLRNGPRPVDTDTTGKPYGQRARGLRSVLLCVADAANRDGKHAHPGLAAIVDGSLYSRRQVVELLHQLVADGWLFVESEGGGRGVATVYSMPRMGAATAPFTEPETVQSEPLNSAVSDLKGAVCDGNSAATTPISVPNVITTVSNNGKEQRATELCLALFVDLWNQWPRRDDKARAQKALQKALDRATADDIRAGACRYVAAQRGNAPKFSKQLASWLNGDCWDDEPVPALNGNQPTPIIEDRSGQSRRVKL